MLSVGWLIALQLFRLCLVKGFITTSRFAPVLGSPRSRSVTTVIDRTRQQSTSLGLDLQDILDDEVDFLAQLKRQIDNPQNASPREVTNRIKSFFGNSKRTPEELNAFRSYLMTNEAVMDVVNAVLLVEGCDRAGLALRDLVGWGVVLRAMERSSPLLTSQIIYRGVSVLRRMRSDDGHSKRYMELLLLRIGESGMVLHGTDVCPAIYSMQAFNANMPEIRQLLSFFAKSLSMTNIVLSSKSVCSAVFGLKRMKPVPEVRQLLAQLARKIEASDTFYHSVNVCIALNGLQTMDDSSPEVRAVLRALMAKSIPAEEQGMDQVSDREISMALFGIQHMGGPQREKRDGHRSDASPELRQVIRYTTALVTHNKDIFEAKRVGLCMLGLSGLSSDTPEVRALVQALAEKAGGCRGEMSGHELSMCLHGLSGLRSDAPEVLRLVSSLAHLVKGCPSMLGADVASALQGLQGLKSKSPPVDALVNEVAGLLARSNVTLSGHDVMQSLYGLQGLGSGGLEVRRLMRSLQGTMRYSTSDKTFDGKDVSMALYGCRGLNSQQEETLALLRALSPYLEHFQGRVTSAQMATALYGLQRLRSDAKEVRRLVGALAPLVARAEGSMSSKSISMALNGLQGLDCKGNDTLALVSALAGQLERAEKGFSGFQDFHEVSAALAGLGAMDATAPPVYRLLCSLARLLEASDMSRMREVRGERVALALFGLQGVSSREQPARDIVRALLVPMRAMTPLRGKELGMALQGFRECAGNPPVGYDEAVLILSTKLGGWAASTRGRGGGASDNQITLRSALWGVSKLDRRHPSVRALLIALASEVQAALETDLLPRELDPKTVNAVREVYRGGELEAEPAVVQMLATAGIDALSVKLPATDQKKWRKKNKGVFEGASEADEVEL